MMQKACLPQVNNVIPSLSGARGFREIVHVPVTTSLHNPNAAASAVRDRYKDMVSSSRAFIADPEWANKVWQNKANAIKKCVRCNRCIFEFINSRHLRCSVNKDVGFERFVFHEILGVRKGTVHARRRSK